jgi:hypothetical protein
MAASDPMTELVEHILWPKLDDARAAKKAARQGAYYAFFVVGLYAISVIRHLTRPTENLFKFDGSAYVIESAVLLVIGFFIFRLSRAAAVIGLIFYLSGLAFSLSVGHFRVIAFSFWILWAVFFVNSVRGTFAYRRLTQEESATGQITAI